MTKGQSKSKQWPDVNIKVLGLYLEGSTKGFF